MPHSLWIAAGFALFAWWFSTGAILWAVRQADRFGTGRQVTLLLLPVALAGGAGIWASLSIGSVNGAYLGFVSVLLVWGWIELAFLTGQVTGPNVYPCPDDVRPFERFIRAWGTIAYHEMSLLAVLVGLVHISQGAENTVALWTFIVLFFARVSAKLNLYLGVPRINTEFIPRPLAHLPSHFRIRRLNWLFPISITALSFAVACWLERLWVAEPAQAVGFALLTAMTALALLEHWLMVLPLPDARLWRWMLPEAPGPILKTSRQDPEGHHGF
ncbi:MAG: DUF3623 domain-containing protein [Rhodobacteraceae bacterium]|nr:DUF3623 domain-containing protein [Paracoccaceae bacterium]